VPGAAAAASRGIPRFSLSATTATANDDLTLRVEETPRLLQRQIRLYLVPRGVAPTVRSRADPRLSFIGSVRASRRAPLVFTVPPLEPGRYALAYWCRGCFPRGKDVGVQASPGLRIDAPAEQGCHMTSPNGNPPPGAPSLTDGWNYHGNGALWALLPPNGMLVANPLGGYKMPWLARPGVSPTARLTVQYRMAGSASPPLKAVTVTGTLIGYEGPSWASRMSFEPGCWQITGRLLDVSLSFVVQVALE
jgi:hypothetical protein